LAGGVKKTIKTMVKSKATEKTVLGDKNVFETAFGNACEIHGATEVKFKQVLGDMAIEKLRELEHYLTHDKTPKDKKIIKVAEYVPKYETMMKTQQKLNMAMEEMKRLLIDNLEGDYGDDDGNVVMEKVKTAVIKVLAVKESTAMAD
jgi:uncharacterized protein YutD